MTAMPGCVSEPLGCGLIDTPGDANVHGLPSLPSIISAAVAAAGGAEEAAVGFEDVGRGGEAERRELGGDDAALRRATGVEGLRHRAEILAQPAGLGRADGSARAASVSRSRPSSFAAPAAAPMAPHVAVLWNPCW